MMLMKITSCEGCGYSSKWGPRLRVISCMSYRAFV